jgi:hypothetical protein
MIKRRNRTRPALPLYERLKRFAQGTPVQADDLPPGQERDRTVPEASASDTDATIERWISSSGLQSPK